MKKIFYLAIICLTFTAVEISFAQNLVSNCSFEQYDTCPDNQGQIQRATGWLKTHGFGDADYYNSCAAGAWSVPPQINYQLAASGNAFGGIIFFSELIGSVEAIHTVLSSPLSPGTTYYVSFKVNLCYNASAFMNQAINKIGAKFTTGPPPLVNNSAHVYSNAVITDSVNWTNISGSFVADSAYTHIFLGVFFDTASVTSVTLSPALIDRAYYFIDDVSVSSDSSVACPVVGIDESSNHNELAIFPNPASDEVRLVVPDPGGKIVAGIYNMMGKKIFSQALSENSKQVTINISSLPPGVYFIMVNGNKKKQLLTNKLVKL